MAEALKFRRKERQKLILNIFIIIRRFGKQCYHLQYKITYLEITKSRSYKIEINGETRVRK